MNIIDECRQLAHAIAPELCDAPLYLLMGEADRMHLSDCHAYATPVGGRVNIALRDRLLTADEWLGPGRAVVFYEADILADCNDFRRAMLELTIHEIAHAVVQSIPTDVAEPSFIARQFDELRHNRDAREVSREPTIEGDHGGPFVRRCVHLWQRAIWQGFHAPIWQICAGFRYGMSHACDYVEALADEPLRMRRASFAEIEATTAPPAFNELWQRDKTNLLESQA